jgi:hypothetical protein
MYPADHYMHRTIGRCRQVEKVGEKDVIPAFRELELSERE